MLIANYNINLPKNILQIMKEKCLKGSAIAERAGYSRQQFSDMMNGRKIIKPCDALVIANTLGVTMDELYGQKQIQTEMGAHNMKTCELVAELEKREGVKKIIAEPYLSREVSVEGPAVILVITD